MSSEQMTFDELNRPILTPEQQRERAWLEAHANSPATTTCRNCEAHVSDRFVKVLGADGATAGCPNCCTYRELFEGAGGDSR